MTPTVDLNKYRWTVSLLKLASALIRDAGGDGQYYANDIDRLLSSDHGETGIEAGLKMAEEKVESGRWLNHASGFPPSRAFPLNSKAWKEVSDILRGISEGRVNYDDARAWAGDALAIMEKQEGR